MSFIHYKLITNKNFEKITFDGVSLSVYDLKKIILEKKFRKQIAAPTQNGSMSTGSMPNKKSSDVDLEITNADTNEVFQRDTDLIPKNSRVRINRVVKSIGPAIAGGTITSTHKQKEHLNTLRQKFTSATAACQSPISSPKAEFLDVKQEADNPLYSDFLNLNEESNSNSCSSTFAEPAVEASTEIISPLVSNATVVSQDTKSVS